MVYEARLEGTPHLDLRLRRGALRLARAPGKWKAEALQWDGTSSIHGAERMVILTTPSWRA